jgi:hypothetical protein
LSSKKLSKEDKLKITNDWHYLFPCLGVFNTMHLMNRIGPLLVGIKLEVKSGGDRYFPTFHIHNLTNSTDFITLSLAYTPNMTFVRLGEHDVQHIKISNAFKENAPIKFAGDQYLHTVLEGFETYINKKMGPIIPQLYEDMTLISGWCGSNTGITRALNLAQSHMETWPELTLTRLGGVDNWLTQIEKKAMDRENLINTCNEQIVKLKVDKLPERALLLDVE